MTSRHRKLLPCWLFAAFAFATGNGTVQAQCCPPLPIPVRPGCEPAPYPYMPSTPTTPSTPSGKQPDGTEKPRSGVDATNPNANNNANNNQNNANPFAQQNEAGGLASQSFTPNLMGDLIGGASVAGPIFVQVTPSGQIVGQPPVVVLPNGQRQLAGNFTRLPSDEALFSPIITPAQVPPNTPLTTVAVSPPPGAVFAKEFATYVSRMPEFTRGTFKITENDNPRPTTRAYVIYDYYDQIFKNVGIGTPRIQLNQETFGYEHAFCNNNYSIGVRLPYNQVVADGFSETSLGDLSIILKGVIMENRQTGNLLSAGMVITAPTGRAMVNTLTGQTVHPTLLQPFVGYILVHRDLFFQVFSAVVVPTSDSDAVLITNDWAAGWFAYRSKGSFLSSLVPAMELHVNTPLTHRGVDAEPVGFVDQVTLLGSLHTYFYDHTNISTAVGAPISGPRPFSLQFSLQFNYQF